MPTFLGTKDSSDRAKSSLQSIDGNDIVVSERETVYLVLTDDLNDTETDILNTSGIPAIGDSLGVLGGIVTDLDIQVDSQVIHPVSGVQAELVMVRVSADNNRTENDSGAPYPNKSIDVLQLEPVINWGTETIEEIQYWDTQGNAILTSADERIPATKEVVIQVLEIQRFEEYPFNPLISQLYGMKVNNTPFWGAAIGTALMMPMDVEEEKILGDKYASVTYRIKFRFDVPLGIGGEPEADLSAAWKHILQNTGTKERKAIGGEPEKATDKKGNIITVNLDLNGIRVSPTAPPTFQIYDKYFSVDFSPLQLEYYAID